MKKLFFLFIVNCSLFIAHCSAQWTIQPSGTKATLSQVCFTDANHGWAVGDSGTILKYNGKQWIKQNSGTKKTLTSVYFLDSSYGWAVGYNGTILKYNGTQWVKQTINSDTNINLSSVYTVDTNNVWVGSALYEENCPDYALGHLFKYNGNNWTGSEWNECYAICSIYYNSNNNGWVAGFGSPYMSNHPISSIIKIDKDKIDDNYKPINPNPYTDGIIYSIYFRDINHGIAVGNFYINGGTTPNTVIMLYNDSVWTYATVKPYTTLLSVFSIDSVNSYAVGAGYTTGTGIIINSTNGGKSWVKQKIDSTYHLNSVYFTDKLNGWIVGANGLILHTSTGGNTPSISEKITYDNKLSTSIKNTKLYLKNSENIIIDSTITDITGAYTFNGVINDSYTIQPVITIPWGGVNPVDALIVNLYYIKLYNFTDNLLKKAADVNADNVINPADAILINRRYIRLINSFKAGDWIWNSDTINVNGQYVNYNFKVVCVGDVNGSYVPK